MAKATEEEKQQLATLAGVKALLQRLSKPKTNDSIERFELEDTRQQE